MAKYQRLGFLLLLKSCDGAQLLADSLAKLRERFLVVLSDVFASN